MPRAIVLHERDNVATLIDPGASGEALTLQGIAARAITLEADIPYGHKCATAAIAAGDEIRKYGEVVGRATCAIRLGEHVHVHNVESLRARGDIETAS